MLQKMYTFIIQRGYMGSLIMLTGLAIMSFMDIKRRAVPVYMIIVMSILAIGKKNQELVQLHDLEVEKKGLSSIPAYSPTSITRV